MWKFKTSKQTKVFCMSTAEQQCWVSWGFPSNLLCIFFPKTQTTPASSQQDLQHPPSRTFTLPSPSPKGSAGLAATHAEAGTELPTVGWPAGWGSQQGPVRPLGGATILTCSSQFHCRFSPSPSQLHAGSSTGGHNHIFRPVLRTWTSILFCVRIYRVDFYSNSLLSLQAQNRVPTVSIKSVNAAEICYHFLSLCWPV